MNSQGMLLFRCNICGADCEFPAAALTRESPSCRTCGSTVRMRAMIHAVSLALFGRPLALPDFPSDKTITGIGLSDWPGYAEPLSEKLGYRNSWYHIEPRLDITAIAPQDAGTLDFIVSTDVFEHVCTPVSRAFDGSMQLLKPEGALVFSVPYVPTGKTLEHFPDMHDFTIEQREGGRVLVNTTVSGEHQEYSDLCFHGGEGDTLEMRVFSLPDLLADLADAGFHDVQVLAEPCFEFGIWHDVPMSLPIIARRSPAQVCVVASGPRSVPSRQPTQADPTTATGTAEPAPAVWLHLDRNAIAVPFELWIGEERVVPTAGTSTLTALVPESVLSRPGSYSIIIRTPGDGRAFAAGSLRVL